MTPTSLVVDLPNWVGDTVMALPAVDRVLTANRGGSSVLHTRPAMARLLRALFPAAMVVATRRRGSPFAAARALRAVHGRSDHGLTLRNSWRAKITLLLAARRRRGSAGQGGSLLLTEAVAVDRARHQAHDSDPVLADLGLASVTLPWSCPLPEALRVEGERHLAGVGLGAQGALVGLAPGSAGHPLKRWPSSSFAGLARSLAATGARPLLLVGPGEESLAAAIVDQAGVAVPVIGVALDVAGLAAAAAALDLVVGVDSGPVHVASMVGTAVIALFGPTRAERTAPLGPGTTVLTSGRPCVGCRRPPCPEVVGGCMAEIPVEGVVDAVHERLAARRAS